MQQCKIKIGRKDRDRDRDRDRKLTDLNCKLENLTVTTYTSVDAYGCMYRPPY